MIAVGMQPSEGALELGACSSRCDRDAPLAAHTLAAKVRHAVERKQYPRSRETVCNIIRDSHVMSNEICAIALWALLRIAESDKEKHCTIDDRRKSKLANQY